MHEMQSSSAADALQTADALKSGGLGGGGSRGAEERGAGAADKAENWNRWGLHHVRLQAGNSCQRAGQQGMPAATHVGRPFVACSQRARIESLRRSMLQHGRSLLVALDCHTTLTLLRASAHSKACSTSLLSSDGKLSSGLAAPGTSVRWSRLARNCRWSRGSVLDTITLSVWQRLWKARTNSRH